MSNKLRPRPDSSALAECRHGTKTHRGYIMHCISGNFMAGGRVGCFATPRQGKKAMKLLDEGKSPEEVQGRIIRAAMRAMLGDLGAQADAAYYGHP